MTTATKEHPMTPLPEAPMPNARKDVQEAYLEQYFVRMVRVCLRGKVIKMAPVEAGTPDRLVMVPKLPLQLVELKTVRGTVDPLQKVWHARAAERGHRVTVLYGTDDIDQWVAAVQRQLDPSVRAAVVPVPKRGPGRPSLQV